MYNNNFQSSSTFTVIKFFRIYFLGKNAQTSTIHLYFNFQRRFECCITCMTKEVKPLASKNQLASPIQPAPKGVPVGLTCWPEFDCCIPGTTAELQTKPEQQKQICECIPKCQAPCSFTTKCQNCIVSNYKHQKHCLLMTALHAELWCTQVGFHIIQYKKKCDSEFW